MFWGTCVADKLNTITRTEIDLRIVKDTINDPIAGPKARVRESHPKAC